MINNELEIYCEYKGTHSQWLKQVPVHWVGGRLKDFLNSSTIVNIPSTLSEDDLVEFLPMTNVNEELGIIRHFNLVPLREVSSGYTKFKNGDVIFAKITPCMENGNCIVVNGLANNICFGSTEFMVFRTTRKLQAEYLHYFLHNYLFRRNAEPFMKGTAGQKRISSQYMMTHYFALPPLDEQQNIVNYLKTKTNQIDRKLDLLTQKLEKYSNLKKSLSNETVTKGLDKTVRMKDSGIEWIGEIPEHWEVERIGTAFEERREKVNDTDYPPLSVTMNGIVPQLDSAAKTDHNDNRKRVAVGDFVINSRSDRRGSSGISELNGSVSVINIVLSPRRHFYGKYLHYLFRSYRFIEEFYRVGRGIVDDLWTTRYAVMRTIDFAFPDYNEQKKISEYLESKNNQIDQIINLIIAQIESQNELRKILINDVVTGKIKVTSIGDEEAI